jgi:hypothetical protein
MFYSKIQFRKVSLLFYILSTLLALYLYVNLRYSWFGFSLIVRVYLYVFCFYMVYIYNITGTQLSESLLPKYLDRYGNKGRFILAFERRVLPFIIIFLITLVYTIIDYIRDENWPWNPILLLLSGRYSNLISYSLILYFILNIRKKPTVAIPIFIIISIVYFFGDSWFYDTFPIGYPVSGYRILKFTAVAFVLLFDGRLTAATNIRRGIISLFIGIATYGVLVGFYYAGYSLSIGSYHLHKRTGFNLAKMGFSFPIKDLQKSVISKKDAGAFSDICRYSAYYGMDPGYSDENLSRILFSQKSQKANEVAGNIDSLDRTLPYGEILGYVKTRLEAGDNAVISAENLSILCARSISGKENEFIDKISNDPDLTIWGIRVLRKSGSFRAMPYLIRLISSLNDQIATEAYDALKDISGIDPAGSGSGRKINTPEVIREFKKLYLETGTYP